MKASILLDHPRPKGRVSHVFTGGAETSSVEGGRDGPFRRPCRKLTRRLARDPVRRIKGREPLTTGGVLSESFRVTPEDRMGSGVETGY